MSGEPIRERYDVIVAGARCAGASTAMLLARQGLDVLVVDPLPPERDPLSTHALMRGGVLQLHRWGLLDTVRREGTPRVHTTVFHYGAQAVPIPIKPSDGLDGLYAPRRTLLDPLLVDAATAAGARVVHGMSVVDLLRDARGRVRGAVVGGGEGPARPVAADLVVGADGVRSRVARLVDAEVLHAGRHATATVYGYWPGVDVGEYHFYFVEGASAGTISTSGGDTCVFASLPPAEFERRDTRDLAGLHRRILETVSPSLAEAVGGRAPSGRLRAFPGVRGFLRRSVGPGWALVGDAGYFKDPATAHGITDALRDAELLARAVGRSGEGTLERDYQAVRDDLVRGLMDVTDRIASFEWRLDEVQEFHLALSREMNAGVDLVRAFDPAPVTPSAGVAAALAPAAAAAS